MASLGMVTSASVDEEGRRVYVSVVVTPERTYNDIMYAQPAKNVWVVPSEKDIVEVYERADGRFAARNPEGETDHELPSGLSEGDIAIKLSADTELLFDRQPDGSYDVTLTAGGALHLDADEVTIGENGEPLATESHTHTDSTGGETGTPNGGLTDMEAE